MLKAATKYTELSRHNVKLQHNIYEYKNKKEVKNLRNSI